MTSRERILSALNHLQPDRVPVDFGGHRSSGIMAIAYARLRDCLDLPKKPIRVYDPVQQLAILDEDVLQRFQVDTLELGRGFALEDRWWTDWELPDGTPCWMPIWAKPEKTNDEWVLRSSYSGRPLARMPAGVIYFEQTSWPYAEHDDLDQLDSALQENMWTGIASPPGPIVAGPDGATLLTEGAAQLRSQTDRAIIGLFGGNLLEMGQFLYRNDNFFLLLAGDPSRAHEFLDKVVEMHLRNLERFLAAVGQHIDVVLFGDDLGMQKGPQISPRTYREFFQPRERLMWQRTRQLAPHLKILLHCCGGVRELLPGLIEAGAGCDQPGPNHLPRHGPGRAEAGVWGTTHLLGWRM